MFESTYRALPGKIRMIIEKIIKRCDKGEYFSANLRKLYRNVYHVEVGIGSYGCFDINQFPPGTRIGNYCSIAPRVYFLFSNHPMSSASTHPLFYNTKLGYLSEDRIERVKLTIGNDVWIGTNTTITRGCTEIGNGAIIGAGSIVTHNVPPYAIVAGNPARLLRMRFDAEIQKTLEECRWFDLEPDILAKYMDDVNNPIIFAEKINEYRKRLKEE